MKIHKFELSEDGVYLPAGKVLLVAQQGQGSLPTIWMEDLNGLMETSLMEVKYLVVGTGQAVPFPAHEHVGSAICGTYVWHVYRDVGNPRAPQGVSS